MPLVARHSDLVLIGRFLIVKPVHHIMRGVFVDRSSDKRSFEPHIVTYPLVPLRKNDSLGWNPVWLYDQSVGMWDVTKPDTITAMRHHIEAIALPPLRAIKTFDDYIAHERAKSTTFYGHFDDRVFTNIFVAAALGDFSKALQLRPQDDRIERYFAKFAPDFFRLWKLEIGSSLQRPCTNGKRPLSRHTRWNTSGSPRPSHWNFRLPQPLRRIALSI